MYKKIYIFIVVFSFKAHKSHGRLVTTQTQRKRKGQQKYIGKIT